MLKLIKENPVDTLGIALGGLLLVLLSSAIGWITIAVLVYGTMTLVGLLYFIPREFIDDLHLFKKYGNKGFFTCACMHLAGEVVLIMLILWIVDLV